MEYDEYLEWSTKKDQGHAMNEEIVKISAASFTASFMVIKLVTWRSCFHYYARKMISWFGLLAIPRWIINIGSSLLLIYYETYIFKVHSLSLIFLMPIKVWRSTASCGSVCCRDVQNSLSTWNPVKQREVRLLWCYLRVVQPFLGRPH